MRKGIIWEGRKTLSPEWLTAFLKNLLGKLFAFDFLWNQTPGVYALRICLILSMTFIKEGWGGIPAAPTLGRMS